MLTEQEIRGAIASCCGTALERCVPDATIYELGFDSLAMASFISHCEMRLSIELGDEAIARLLAAQTVGEIISLLQAQRSS